MLLPKIEVDETLPPGTVEFREPTQEFKIPYNGAVRVKGRLLGKIVNVGDGVSDCQGQPEGWVNVPRKG